MMNYFKSFVFLVLIVGVGNLATASDVTTEKEKTSKVEKIENVDEKSETAEDTVVKKKAERTNKFQIVSHEKSNGEKIKIHMNLGVTRDGFHRIGTK